MKIAVIGSGVAGIYSALYLSNKGHQVTLIESAKEMGGLLRSVPGENGQNFDCGSHFLRDTGVEEIDQELFYPLSQEGWSRLSYLKIGTYFNGVYYDKSPFINTHALPKHLYEKGLVEMMSLPPHDGEGHSSCFSYLTSRFGETFTNHLFRPAIEKFMFEKIENLAPRAGDFFDLVRLLTLDPVVSREIKKAPWFDDRIGFHFSYEGLAGLNNYYPATGGIGQFIDEQVRKLQERGVTLLTQTQIQSVETKGQKITKIKSEKGEWDVEALVWTVPINAFNKLVKGPTLPAPKGLKILTSVLLDYTFDKPFDTDVYYSVCYDPSFKSFRIFYSPNTNSKWDYKDQYSTCVEVIVPYDKIEEVDLNQVEQELKTMRFVPANAKCTYARKRVEGAGFPQFTNAFVKAKEELLNASSEAFNNVLFVGKSSRKAFFMNSVLIETHNALKEFSENL